MTSASQVVPDPVRGNNHEHRPRLYRLLGETVTGPQYFEPPRGEPQRHDEFFRSARRVVVVRTCKYLARLSTPRLADQPQVLSQLRLHFQQILPVD